MSSTNIQLFLILIILQIYIFKICHANMCFVCRSQGFGNDTGLNGLACQDPFNQGNGARGIKAELVDCTNNGKDCFYGCRKTKQVLTVGNGIPDQTIYIRSCVKQEAEIDNGCKRKTGYDFTEDVCICQGEGCNVAHKNLAFPGIILVASLLCFINGK